MTRALRPLLVVHGLVFLLLMIPVLAKLSRDIPPESMLRDPAQVMGAPMYTGLLSNFGLVLWGSTATICIMAAIVRPGLRAFWAYAAALTLVLLADDWLLLHDVVLPALGVPGDLVYVVYALAVFGYLRRYRKAMNFRQGPILLLAFAWFAASVGLDQLDGRVAISALYLWEDGAKLFGIATWLLFHGTLAHELLTASPARPRGEPDD